MGSDTVFAADGLSGAAFAPQADSASGASAWFASLDLVLEYRAGQGSVLARRRHDGPLRVQKVLYPEGPELAHILIVHPPGGIAAGDALSISVHVADRAQTLLTTPGAAKWYKSFGPASSQNVSLSVAAGGLLEWLPQESILFDGVAANLRLRLDCAAGARACGWDVSVLGRRGSNEHFTTGSVRQQLELFRDGQLLWAERGSIAGGDALLQSPLGWNGMHVSGLFWALGTDIDDALLAHCRAQAIEGTHLGITRFAHGLLVARVLGESPERVRSVLTSIWTSVRPALSGRQGVVPRIWAT